ncbi:MAG: PQQ-dependent sugar dehydrogenase [Sedimenticola sp.]
MILAILCVTPQSAQAAEFRVVPLVKGLEHPWGMAFLPDGRILVTERPGQLRLIDNNRLLPEPVGGLPEIAARGQGGLLDVALHPDYEDNGWVYLAYSAPGDGGIGTEVGRGRLQGNRLVEWQRLFRLLPKSGTGYHFGSRLVFDRAGYLYITLGDRGERKRAQQLDDHAGSIIRLHDDGRVPVDNPFVKSNDARPEIYSYGHRNPQGAILHPQSGRLWIHEHGPQGGDEINVIAPAINYGWPVISYGAEYGIGIPVGEGTHKPGMAQPIYYWDPSIAPSGMMFYTGDRFPQWKDNLFVGSLKFQLLVRLEVEGEKVLQEERLLKGELGRIRDVRNGPDGYIYLLTDSPNGQLVRLEPADSGRSD